MSNSVLQPQPANPSYMRQICVAGFTMIEILVVVIIISIMSALAISHFSGYGSGRAMRQTVQSWQSLIPVLQTRAVLEPAVLGVNLTADGFQVYHLMQDLRTHSLVWEPVKTGRLAGMQHFQHGIHINIAPGQNPMQIGDFLQHGNSPAALAQAKKDLAKTLAAQGKNPSSETGADSKLSPDAANLLDNKPTKDLPDQDLSQGIMDKNDIDTDGTEADSADVDSDQTASDSKLTVGSGITPAIILLPNGDMTAVQLLIHGNPKLKPIRLYISAGGEVYTKDHHGHIVLPETSKQALKPSS